MLAVLIGTRRDRQRLVLTRRGRQVAPEIGIIKHREPRKQLERRRRRKLPGVRVMLLGLFEIGMPHQLLSQRNRYTACGSAAVEARHSAVARDLMRNSA